MLHLAVIWCSSGSVATYILTVVCCKSARHWLTTAPRPPSNSIQITDVASVKMASATTAVVCHFSDASRRDRPNISSASSRHFAPRRSSGRRHIFQQVCVQLPTSAVNVALPAFAAARRAAAPCCCGAGRATIDRYLLSAGRTAANPPRAAPAGE